MKNSYLFWILFLCSGFLSCTSGNESETSPESLDKYRIAYNVLLDEESENYEVFSMKPDGSDKVNISGHPGVDWVYYAHGNKVYFISDRDTCYRCYFLYESDATGDSIRQVSDIRLNDSWMSARKDGQELIVRPWSKEDSVFYIINLQGELVGKVDPQLPYINDPFFSPDGQQVVFRGSRSPFSEEREHVDELYIINVDGTGMRQLTTYPKSDTTAEWHAYHAGPPYWEPNGNFITYMSKQNGKYSLFRVSPEGGAPTRVLPDEVKEESYHAWSPGGEWLAVEMKDEDGNYDIYIKDKSGNVKRLTDSERMEQSPVFVRVQ